MTVLLDRVEVEVVGKPSEERVSQIEDLVEHPGDAVVLAGAMDGDIDYFVTLDREHFLDNPAVLGLVPFPMGTPGDFLKWYRLIFGQNPEGIYS